MLMEKLRLEKLINIAVGIGWEVITYESTRMVTEDVLVEEGEPRAEVVEDELGVGGEEVVARRQVQHESSLA